MDFDIEFAGAADFARLYRSLGLQVVPAIEPREAKEWKRPAIKWRPIENDLVDDATFEGWFGPEGEHARRQNIGLITGKASGGAFIIDLDTYKNPEANAWWQHIEASKQRAGDLETPTQRTGGGGLQLLFRAPPGWAPPTNRTKIGVDIRGQGGFAVLAPSLHESGRRYEWLEGCEPWEIEIATAPEWLCREIDELVREHGGKQDAPTAQKTDSPGQAYNEFGKVVDGREEMALRIVWARVLDLYREAPIRPPKQEIEEHIRDTFLIYERKAKSRLPAEVGVPNAALLEKEGRGITMFRAKWQHALDQWDTKVREQAAIQRPREPETPAQAQKAQGGQKTDSEDWDAPATPAAPKAFAVEDIFPINERDIPPRDWIVPGLLMHGHLSVLVAPPGSGKSLLSCQLAIMVGLGLDWGGWRTRKPEKVVLINSEDDRDEMRRRLAAACREMGVDQRELRGRVFIAENPDNIVIAQSDPKTKAVHRTALFDQLSHTITDNGIGVLMVDPFAETFIGDENSNSEVKWAGIIWRELARLTDVGLLLVHHTRKNSTGMAGDADASRGGGALIGTARVLSTLFTMTPEDATKLGVDPDERTRYVRFDDAKANLTLVSPVAKWFEKKSVTLDNAKDSIPADEIGVLAPWEPPSPFDGLATSQLHQCLDRIRDGLLNAKGEPSGEFYAMAKNSPRYVGLAIQETLHKDPEEANRIVDAWKRSGLLTERGVEVNGRVVKVIGVEESKRPGRTF